MDNPPAFPPFHDPSKHESGMSLRDWFAGQALAGWFASEHSERPIETGDTIDDVRAEMSACFYAYADAMLAERKRNATTD